MKKKYIIILFSILYIAVSAHSQESIDLANLSKVFYLAGDANVFEESGKSIKAKRIDVKIKQILDSMFREGKTISFSEKVIFQREQYGGQNRYFIIKSYNPPNINGYDSPSIRFEIRAKDDPGGTWGQATSDKIVEKFEEIIFFKGTFVVDRYKIGNVTYDFNRQRLTLNIYCKIISLDPLEKQKESRPVSVLNPHEVLRKLETGEEVSKDAIIQTLKKLLKRAN